MISHVVLLQPKPETTPDDIAAALLHVRQLQETIPGILNISIGNNLSSYNKGYTHGFIMQFPNEDELHKYANHPAHKPVSDELQAMCGSIIDFDLPDNRSSGTSSTYSL